MIAIATLRRSACAALIGLAGLAAASTPPAEARSRVSIGIGIPLLFPIFLPPPPWAYAPPPVYYPAPSYPAYPSYPAPAPGYATPPAYYPQPAPPPPCQHRYRWVWGPLGWYQAYAGCY